MKYFLHDTSSFQDEKITELFINYGYEGLGLFYTILEKIALQEKPIKTSVLKAQLKIGKRLEKCWCFMEEIDLIQSNNNETFNVRLLSYSEKYQIKKEKNAKRISEWRKNQEDTKNVTCYESVCNTPKVKESKVNISKENIISDWRTDYNVYKSELLRVYQDLIIDKDFITKQEKYNPNVDISLSLEKAVNNYWITESGWKKKKQSRAKEIDWKATLTNAIGMNKVYKQTIKSHKEIQPKPNRSNMIHYLLDGFEKTHHEKAYYENLKSLGAERVQFLNYVENGN
jgi:hypothetical protein